MALLSKWHKNLRGVKENIVYYSPTASGHGSFPEISLFNDHFTYCQFITAPWQALTLMITKDAGPGVRSGSSADGETETLPSIVL